jgi:hypothetical protein
MAGHVNAAWFLAILVVLFVAFNFLPLFAIWIATHEDQRDILRHGVSGTGVVTSITSGLALLCGPSTSPLEVSLHRPYQRMALAPYVGYTFDGEPKLRVGSRQGRAEPA